MCGIRRVRLAFCLHAPLCLGSCGRGISRSLTWRQDRLLYLTKRGSRMFTTMTTNIANVTESEDIAARVREAGDRLFRGKYPPTVISVLGGPGSGKGTLSATLASRLGYVHLSAGELLREAACEESEEGRMIRGMLSRGDIVPSVVTVGILYRKIGEALEKGKMHMPWRRSVLIDGFPRNLDNLLTWERTGGIFRAVLSILCEEQVMMQRLRKRSSSSARSDDNDSIIPRRLEVHRREFAAIERYYTAKNLLMGIDGHASPKNVVLQAETKLSFVEEEMLLQLNKQLLNAIVSKDYEVYEQLTDSSMTCFEPEAAGYQIDGQEFHRYYLQPTSLILPRIHTSIVNSNVRIIGNAAVVSYVRVVEYESKTEAFEETRVWERKRDNGQVSWRCVHFHRSKVAR